MTASLYQRGSVALPAFFTRNGLRNLLDAPYSGSVERRDLSNYKFAITTRFARSSESYRREKRRRQKGESMKTKMVRYTLETLPPLTKAQRANLKALAARPDSEIDTSDAPELTDEQWKHAVRGRFYRPVKRQITARVDADVLAWLKGQGRGYQSRINAILRREMLEALKAGKEVA